jgi:predicted amidohydrolase YtcJ
MDAEIGSITVGKHADFAVLDSDPTIGDPMAMKDVPVAATVLSGIVHEN